MISFNEALSLVLSQEPDFKTEEAGLAEACRRVLAVDVISGINLPPFHKSAVDGYACRRADLPGPLRLTAVIAAGTETNQKVGAGECIKIMTGARVPEGADCVMMVEDCTSGEDNTIICLSASGAANICYKAEDVKSGQTVLKAGSLLNPGHIAVLASVGCSRVRVFSRPVVGIISTGDELTEPGGVLSATSIYNSNSWQLMAQAEALNCIARYYGIAGDSAESTTLILKKAMLECDVVLLTGGVSMGDFDLVPAVMEGAGYKIVFRKIAIQPGKPTVFGASEKGFCFGLPGNPVSSFVLFELLVKPFLLKMSGSNQLPALLQLTMGREYSRKKSERLSVLPVNITPEGTVEPVDYHGSAHIHAMAFAQALLLIPPGQTRIQKGDSVHVRLI